MNEFKDTTSGQVADNEGELRVVTHSYSLGSLHHVDIYPTRTTLHSGNWQFLRFKDAHERVRFIYTTRKGERITKKDVTKCIAFLKAMDVPFHPDFKEKPTDAL